MDARVAYLEQTFDIIINLILFTFIMVIEIKRFNIDNLNFYYHSKMNVFDTLIWFIYLIGIIFQMINPSYVK